MRASKEKQEKFGTLTIERVALEEEESFLKVAMEKETGVTLEMSSMHKN